MAEELDRASPDRQAIWVALKTLRQRPTVVGRTDDGATVYGIRSVQLVLPAGASHFKRLVPCAKCERRVPGPVILGPADLDRPANSVFCGRCGQAVGRPGREVSGQAGEAPVPAPPRAAQPVVTESGVDDGRLAAVEAQLAELQSRPPAPDERAGELRRLSEQVAVQLRGQNAELAKVSASVAEVHAQIRELGESNRALDHARAELEQRMVELAARVAALPVAVPEGVAPQDLADLRAGVTDMIDATAQALHAALREGLDHLGAEIAAAKRTEDEPTAHSHTEIEERLARDLVEVGTTLAAALSQGLDHFRSEMASLQRRVDEAAVRSEMEQVAEASRELAQAQREVDEKVGDLVARVATLHRPDPEAVAGGELAEPRAGILDRIGAEGAQLRGELAEGLGSLRAEIGLLEQRSQDEFAAVAALLEAQRKELTEALHDVAQETLMAVAEPLRDLTKAREDFERRLESLQRRAQEDQRRVEVLNASADAGASKLHALEQKIHGALQRLIHPAEAGSEARAVGPAPAVERRPPGALLESLERQLREAEERLGQL